MRYKTDPATWFDCDLGGDAPDDPEAFDFSNFVVKFTHFDLNDEDEDEDEDENRTCSACDKPLTTG